MMGESMMRRGGELDRVPLITRHRFTPHGSTLASHLTAKEKPECKNL